jgi:hypothetical protein
MSERIFDSLTRRTAAAMSRRCTLLTLGSAVVAAAAGGPTTTSAARRGKKTNNRCQNQVGGCRSVIAAVCELEPAQCLAAVDCCSSLGTCNVTAFFDCLAAVSS